MTDNQSIPTPPIPAISGEPLRIVTDDEVLQHLEAIKEALDDKKAIDMVVLDLKDKSTMADYFVVCSGNSRPQTRALSESAYSYIKDEELQLYSFEGRQEAQWVLLDIGFIVVHVFQEEQRSFYDLEQLWSYSPGKKKSVETSDEET